MRWFRFYTEALDDPKVQRLPCELFKHWVNLLCLAGRCDGRGLLPPMEDIAFGLRLSEEQVGRACMDLCERGLLDYDPHEQRYRMAAWGERYAASPRLTGREWRAIRAEVFERDDYRCTYCGQRAERLECDHITPHIRGGCNSLDNLTTACRSCNRRKHAKTPDEWEAQSHA